MTDTQLNAEGREVIAVISGPDELDATLGDLEAEGYPPQTVNLVAESDEIAARYRERYEVANDTSPPNRDTRLSYLSYERLAPTQTLMVSLVTFAGATGGITVAVASGGTLAPIIGAAALGAGAGVAAAGGLATLVRNRHAEVLRNQMANGKTLVSVRVSDDRHEELAHEVLERHTNEDLHVLAPGVR